MKQALHIFKKDIRYLRYEIAMTLLVAAAFCYTGVRHGVIASGVNPNQGAPWQWLTMLLPVTWWFLITRVIQAEPLTGDRQFWLTRPYEWKSLLGAKALFILLFVNIPLLIADIVILPAFGFSVGHEIPGILWTQVLLIIALALPVAALSTIVTGIAPLIGVILILVCSALTSMIFGSWLHSGGVPWMELEWMRIYYALAVAAAAAITILLWQYTRRRTSASRLVAGIAVLTAWAGVSLFPWTTAFALQMHLSRQTIDPSSVHVALDSGKKWLGRVYPGMPNQMSMDLPLEITGVPAGMRLKPNGLTITLRAPDGEVWHVDQPPSMAVGNESGIISLRATAGNKFYTKVKDLPIQMDGALFFTLYGNSRMTDIPLQKSPVPISGIGVCSAGSHFLLCSSAFRAPTVSAVIRIFPDSAQRPTERVTSPRWIGSYAPFFDNFSVNPVDQLFLPQVDAVSGAVISTLEPLAHLKRDFEINNVRLRDFELPSPTVITVTPDSRRRPR